MHWEQVTCLARSREISVYASIREDDDSRCGDRLFRWNVRLAGICRYRARGIRGSFGRELLDRNGVSCSIYGE